MIVSKTIRLLFGCLMSGMLLVASFSSPALAAARVVPIGQIQTSTESLNVDKPTSYTAADLKKIEKSANEVQSLRSRLEAFQTAIEQREWSEVHRDVAKLLPDLKQKMMNVTDQLELRDRILARAVSTEVFIHLERIDEADEVYDYQAAETNYFQALQDFDAFFNSLPES